MRAGACRAAAVATGLAWLATIAGAADTPGFDAVRAAYRPSDVIVRDRHGEPLQSLRVQMQVRRLPWVALDELSPALLTAIVLSEDRRFWAHSGVDWRSLARSAFANAWNHRTQGASTVTMQLAGLLDVDLARPAGGRSLMQKASQITQAAALERRWRKAQILEAYLNLVPLRGELVGVNAGAQMMFGRHPGGLDTLQAAVLAALVRAPNADAQAVSRRACELLRAQSLACDGLASEVERALARRAGAMLGEALAPHAARQALAMVNAAGTSAQAAIVTTLDARLQRTALAAVHQQLAELKGRHVNDAAVLVLDNARGDVLAWVGSPGDADSPTHAVDSVLARRQSGSAIKPFVYQLAFERRLLTTESLLDDSPLQMAGGNGVYAPQNYDGGYKGWVSARVALGASLNVPAVRTGLLVGVDPLFERLNAWGLRLSESAGYHGPALALGSAEITLADLTNAYRALANRGRWSAWRLMPSATAGGAPARQVGDAAGAFLVGDILADNNARALTFGLDSALVPRGFAAVKTGTSKDLRDNWCVGFTDRYTVGVWVGNAAGAPMQGVSGTTGAAPIWHAMVEALHRGSPSVAPAPPPGLVKRSAAPNARQAWFIEGTEPLRAAIQGRPQADDIRRPPPGATRGPFVALGDEKTSGGRAFSQPVSFSAGISHPVNGTRFALDPDMPPPSQRIQFAGEAGRWMLDGRLVGSGSRVAWAPWPGRHRLELRANDGRLIDAVSFEVRGATLKASR